MPICLYSLFCLTHYSVALVHHSLFCKPHQNSHKHVHIFNGSDDLRCKDVLYWTVVPSDSQPIPNTEYISLIFNIAFFIYNYYLKCGKNVYDILQGAYRAVAI